MTTITSTSVNEVQCLLLRLMVADLQCRVVVNEWHFQLIHSHPVNATLLAVQLDAVQVHHSGKDGQLHIALIQNMVILMFLMLF